MKKAVAAGGKLLSPLDDEGDGDRRGTMADPFGHVWMVATHKRDVSSDEIAGARRPQVTRLNSCGTIAARYIMPFTITETCLDRVIHRTPSQARSPAKEQSHNKA